MKDRNVNSNLERLSWLTRLLLTLAAAMLLTACVSDTENVPEPASDAVPAQPVVTAEPAEDAEVLTGEADEAGESADERQVISLDHIHGMGWDADGEALTVATHTGLRTFAESRWFESSGPAHDYIALAPTADGFYASGHPAASASEGDPLGLVKSIDGGETLEMLSFEGESEIHFLGAGYGTNVVYAVIDAENSIVSPGLHYTLDDGETWHSSAAQGITAVTIQLAAHPTDAAIIAFGTEGGVLLSTDNGNSFTLVTESTPLSAVTFSPAEEGVLYYGLTQLMRLAPDGSDPTAINMPELRLQDAMIAIAVNPQNSNEIAIATFDSYVWRTLDGGENWQLIADPAAQ